MHGGEFVWDKYKTAVSVLVKAQNHQWPPTDNYLQPQSPGLADTKLSLMV